MHRLDLKSLEKELDSLFSKDFLAPEVSINSLLLNSLSSSCWTSIVQQDLATYNLVMTFSSFLSPDSDRTMRFLRIKDFIYNLYPSVDPIKLKEVISKLLFLSDFLFFSGSKRSVSNCLKEALMFKNKNTSKDQCIYCESCGFRFKKVNYTDSTLVDLMKPIKDISRSKFRTVQFDHIYPYSKSGATDIENLQILCGFCNLAKSNKISLFQYNSNFMYQLKGIKNNFIENYFIPQSWVVFRTIYKRPCSICQRTAVECELTVKICQLKRQPTPDNIECICYECLENEEDSNQRYISNENYSKLVKI